jgi:glutaminyl-tRNA synthetase
LNYSLLELCIRKDLDNKAKRTMAIVDPVKLILTNVDDAFVEKISVPDFPKDPARGSHDITLQKELWVERSDIKLEDVKDFFGIAPGKTIGLKYANLVKITDIKVNDKKEVTEVRGELHKSNEKAKSYLHWIACKESADATTRLYDVLFTVHNPNELEDYLTALNPDSLKTHNNSKIHRNLLSNMHEFSKNKLKIFLFYLGLKVEDKVQFERSGFFAVDRDSNIASGHLVFNRTVTLADKERQKVVGKK